jgi:hypothetical protein
VKATSATDGVEEAGTVADVFERVACGIDGSQQSVEALRQVERLRPPNGELHLVSVAELSLAVHGGFAAPALYDRLLTDAESPGPSRRAPRGHEIAAHRGRAGAGSTPGDRGLRRDSRHRREPRL